MKESVKNTEVLVTQSCPTLCDPGGCSRQAPLSVGFSRQEYWSRLPFPPPGDSSRPGDQSHVSYIYLHRQAGSFTTSTTWEAPTGVGSHSLPQRTLPTHGLNPGLPHCRQILYQPPGNTE